MVSPHGAALISEYQERGWRQRVSEIAGYDYRGICSGSALWSQMWDLHMLALCDKHNVNRDYRAIAVVSPSQWGPLANRGKIDG